MGYGMPCWIDKGYNDDALIVTIYAVIISMHVSVYIQFLYSAKDYNFSKIDTTIKHLQLFQVRRLAYYRVMLVCNVICMCTNVIMLALVCAL